MAETLQAVTPSPGLGMAFNGQVSLKLITDVACIYPFLLAICSLQGFASSS